MARLLASGLRFTVRPPRQRKVTPCSLRYQSTSRGQSTTSSHGTRLEVEATVKNPQKQISNHNHHYWAEVFWMQVQPLAYPFRAYNRAQSRRPYVVQLTTSLIIYFFGDLTAQYIQRPVEPPVPGSDASKPPPPPPSFKDRYNPDRTLRALITGGIFSIPSYHWFLFLSRNFNISPARTVWAFQLSLLTKIVVNQVAFTPVFNSYFFGMQSFLTTLMDRPPGWRTIKAGFAEARTRIINTVPTSWWNSCKFWPIVTAFSFTFIRPQNRSVFAGVVAIGWQAYLGILNQRAAEKEAALVAMGAQRKAKAAV